MNKHKNNRYGYSFVGLWPGYAIFSGIILFASPLLSPLLAFVVACVSFTAYLAWFRSIADQSMEEIRRDIDAYVASRNRPAKPISLKLPKSHKPATRPARLAPAHS